MIERGRDGMKEYCNIFIYCSRLLVLISPFILNQVVSARVNDISTAELFEMDLEELMDIEVTVASINPESLSETPAIVSSYSAKDLERMGLRSFRDFLSFVPGLLYSPAISQWTQLWYEG